MLVGCGITVAATYGANLVLDQQLYLQWIIVEGICVVFYLFVVMWNLKKEKKYFFHYDWIQLLSLLGGAVVSFARVKTKIPRLFAMNALLCVWCIGRIAHTLYFIFQEHKSVDFMDKCRLKWAPVYNDYYVEKTPMFAQWQQHAKFVFLLELLCLCIQ